MKTARAIAFLIGLLGPAGAASSQAVPSSSPTFIRSMPVQQPLDLYSLPYTEASCERTPFECAVRRFEYNPANAAGWFERAAEAGDARAMRALGHIYLRGTGGLAADRRKGLEYFYEAALQGDAESMFMLGRAFERGIAVEADAGLARYWLLRAADRGYGAARRALK